MDFNFDLFQPIILAMAVSGVVAGFLAGLLGIGGGIVTVPVLFTAFGLIGTSLDIQMHMAVATSLAIIIPTAFVSTLSHATEDAVSSRLVIHWGLWIFLGALGGTYLASLLDARAMVGFFAFMAAMMAVKMLLPLDDRSVGSRPPRGPLGAAIAVTIGTFSSLMGIGGATFSVPVMTLFRMPIHRAVGTAAALGMIIAVPAALGYMIAGWRTPGLPPLSLGYVNLVGIAVVAPLSMAFAPLGAMVAHRLSKRVLTVLFGIFLVIAALRMILPLLNSG